MLPPVLCWPGVPQLAMLCLLWYVVGSKGSTSTSCPMAPTCTRLDNAKQASRLRQEFEAQARAIQGKYEAHLRALQQAAEAHYAAGGRVAQGGAGQEAGRLGKLSVACSVQRGQSRPGGGGPMQAARRTARTPV